MTEATSEELFTEVVGVDAEAEAFVRQPGLFRRWEIERVLAADGELRVEPAGAAADGTPLFAVYRREPLIRKETE
jgi:hypothetical protein